MAWCETHGIEYIFGLPGNAVLKADPVIATTADACAVIRAERALNAHRTHCETTYAAKSWGGTKRRVIARIEATTLGLDIRTIVTSIRDSTPERLYEFTYCARGTGRSATSGTLAATSLHAPHVSHRNPKPQKKRRKPRNNSAWPKSSEQAQRPPSDSHSNTLMNNPG